MSGTYWPTKGVSEPYTMRGMPAHTMALVHIGQASPVPYMVRFSQPLLPFLAM